MGILDIRARTTVFILLRKSLMGMGKFQIVKFLESLNSWDSSFHKRKEFLRMAPLIKLRKMPRHQEVKLLILTCMICKKILQGDGFCMFLYLYPSNLSFIMLLACFSIYFLWHQAKVTQHLQKTKQKQLNILFSYHMCFWKDFQ